jgi:HEAT repeat protein
VEAVGTGDERVVAAACTALKAIGSPDAVEHLAPVLANGELSARVRAAVASTIAALKGPLSARAIVAAAKDPSLASVIPSCFAAMGPLVVPVAVEALADPSPAVRKVMTESLAAIGAIAGDEAAKGLSRALRDQDADVRSAAAQALQKMGRFTPLVIALKDEQFDNRFVIQALNTMGSKNRELNQAYVNLLEAMGRKVTTGSMFAVEKLRDADLLPPALRYLEEVTQNLPDESEFMEPAIRLKREVRAALASRGRA